ncbi:MAG: hypothetical protein KJ062_05620, partial [Thermoanaerobaculia bacterium]|nr:hypothetical protein [Thermoanaerobaculia bacterium]
MPLSRRRAGEGCHALAVPCAAILAAILLSAAPLEAARYRVVDENGKAVPGARVSVLGRAGSVAADPSGVLTLDSEPAAPFELGIF